MGKYLAPFRIRSNFKNDGSGGLHVCIYARICVGEGAGGIQRITAIRPEAYDTERVRVQRYAVWSSKI